MPAAAAAPNVTPAVARQRFLAQPKVARWVARYPASERVTAARRVPALERYTVDVWATGAGLIATGIVDAQTGAVLETWVGPQAEWTMARGRPAAFGGTLVTRPVFWLALCGVFLLGLADVRRPLSWRNLDLLVLLSFSVALAFFDHGRVFASVALTYPPLLYLVARLLRLGLRRGATVAAARAVWPVWALAAATIFLVGVRAGVTLGSGNVIDVGFADVAGADRILSGTVPWGHMPSPIATGDTYGPVAYLATVPGLELFGWSGRWDSLPAAQATAILFDLLCLVGLALVGRRLGGGRLAATLAFAWAAYPFTLYALASGTNDAMMPAFLIWGFLAWTSGPARGAALALASWTKFAALPLAPLWLGRSPARRGAVAAFLVVTAACFSVLLLDPAPLHAARVFWYRTISVQLGRQSPFSIWGWHRYRALPDLRPLQHVLMGFVAAGAIALAVFPRRRLGPVEVAALSAAVLVGVQLTLTHWFYLYLLWPFPFVAVAVLTPAAVRARAAVPAEVPDRDGRELAAAR